MYETPPENIKLLISISTVPYPHPRRECIIYFLRAGQWKDSCGPTVVVKNCDLHDAGPAQLEGPALLLGLQVRQLQEELLVRLPLVVVHDRDANLITKFSIMMW